MPLQVIRVVVPTPGTIVRVTTTPTMCAQVRIQPRLTNTGKTFVGLSTLARTTGVGAIAEFPAMSTVTSGVVPDVTLAASGPDPDPIDLSTLYVDADVAGEAVLITAVQV